MNSTKPGNQHAPDAELMQRLADGDTSALAELAQRHQQRVRLLAYRMTSRWDMADDIAQETFLRLYRAAAAYQPTAAFSTWLYRIVVNLCLDQSRRRHLVGLPAECMAPDQPGDQRLLQKERTDAIRRAVEALPERQRTALVLHRFEGLNHERIAEVTGWSVSAVESLLVRAYDRLREQLKSWSEK